MFSGPDYLYVDAFLPNRSTYVLSALEPVGPIPHPHRGLAPLAVLRAAGLRASLGTVLSYSFFITKKMRATSTATTFRGTLPILYVFLARSGKTIQEVSLVAINDDGTIVPAGQDDAQSTAPGVKIVFSGSDGKPQTLYYFRTDISDDGLKKSGFLKFAGKLGKGDSFIKSASYLPHADSFSKIRDFLLESAAKPWSRTTPASRSASSSPRNGGCARSAAISARSASSRAAIRRGSTTSSTRPTRRASISAWAIAGGPTNRTFSLPRRSGDGEPREGIFEVGCESAMP